MLAAGQSHQGGLTSKVSRGQFPLVLLHESINIKSIVKYIVKNVLLYTYFVTVGGYI